jgi:hypothetical protein
MRGSANQAITFVRRLHKYGRFSFAFGRNEVLTLMFRQSSLSSHILQ